MKEYDDDMILINSNGRLEEAMIKVGELWHDEEVVKVDEEGNIFVTSTYCKVSCRWFYNFYYLDTKTHWFSKGR